MTIEVTIDPREQPRRWSLFKRKAAPTIMAIFAYRYDVALVPDLIANIRPFVDGWISLDDRASSKPYSTDRERRLPLIEAAIANGADWILAVDPDERFEEDMTSRIQALTAVTAPTVWGFHLRELYSPTAYRVDGVWGTKVQHRLFNLPRGRAHKLSDFPISDLHATWFPAGHRLRNSGLNLYHLKMINPERRQLRRDLYVTLDPSSKYQRIGYDYLAIEDGARLEEIPRDRGYQPAHRDDGGLWMVDPALVASSGLPS